MNHPLNNLLPQLDFEHIGSGWYEADAPANLGYFTKVRVRLWPPDQLDIYGKRGQEQEILFKGRVEDEKQFLLIYKLIQI